MKSGLQKEVLKLYRDLLRTARTKDPSLELLRTVSSSFRDKAMSVGPKEWNRIEHMIRMGYKQKKLMEMPGFTGAHQKQN